MTSPISKILVIALLMHGLAPFASAQLIVAHRGASADAPENTLSAFRLAWEQNSDAIEGDFRLTADGQVACIHDKTTKRTAGTELLVSASTLDELKALDVGSWKDAQYANEVIPTLAEVLETVPKGKYFFIEIKSGPEILPAVKQVLEKSNVPWSNLRIISFKREVIKRAKQLLPEVESFWLFEFKWDNEHQHWYPSAQHAIGVASEIGADGLDVKANKPALAESFMRLCQQAGFSLHAYTVDDPKVAVQLQSLEYDSITTNRPQFLREALKLPQTELASQAETISDTQPVGVLEGIDSK